MDKLCKWIRGEYDSYYDKLEKETDQSERDRLEGVADGLMHVMAHIKKEDLSKSKKKNYPQCVNCWWYAVEAEKACEKCGMCAFDE